MNQVLDDLAINVAQAVAAVTESAPSAENLDDLIAALPSGQGSHGIGFGVELFAASIVSAMAPPILEAIRELVQRLSALGISAAENWIAGKLTTNPPDETPNSQAGNHTLTPGEIVLTHQQILTAVKAAVERAQERGLTPDAAEAMGHLFLNRLMP